MLRCGDLFVAAGIIRMSDIVGYRNQSVYIKDSRHIPPTAQKVLDYIMSKSINSMRKRIGPDLLLI